MTVESFHAWKAKFDAELAAKKAKEDDEKLKNLTPKEREEWKRAGTRLSGKSRQLAMVRWFMQLYIRSTIIRAEP